MPTVTHIIDSNLPVYATGNQIVSGVKTFTNSTIELSSSSGILIIPSQDIMSQSNDYDINLQSYPYTNTYVSIGLNTGKLGESINNFDGNVGTREIKFWERGGFFAETTGVFIRLGRSGVIISENQDSKVGIGTRFPQEKLHISGGNLRVDGGTNFNERPIVNETGLLLSGEAVGSNGTITTMIKLTQAQYNALSPKDPTTFYVIVD